MRHRRRFTAAAAVFMGALMGTTGVAAAVTYVYQEDQGAPTTVVTSPPTTVPPAPAATLPTLVVTQRVEGAVDDSDPAVLTPGDGVTVSIVYKGFDGSQVIGARYDSVFFDVNGQTPPGTAAAGLVSWEGLTGQGTLELRLAAKPVGNLVLADRSASELRTAVVVTATQGGVEISRDVVGQTFSRVIMGATNDSEDRGRSDLNGVLALNVAAGDCVAFSVNVVSGGLGTDARLVVTFDPAVYVAVALGEGEPAIVDESVAPDDSSAPPCVVPPQFEIGGNTISAPIVTDTDTATFELQVRESAVAVAHVAGQAAPGVTVRAALLAPPGVGAGAREIASAASNQALWSLDVVQRRGQEQASGALLRLFPSDQVEVLATLSTSVSPLPDDVRLRFEFASPLFPGDNAGLTSDDNSIEGPLVEPRRQITAIFEVAPNLPEEFRGEDMELTVRALLGDAVLAERTVLQRIPASISVTRGLTDASGTPITELRAGDTFRVAMTVANNSGAVHKDVTVTDTFDAAFFQPVGASVGDDESTSTTTTSAPADESCELTDGEGEPGTGLTCTVTIPSIEPGGSDLIFYDVQVRRDLNVGTVQTELRGDVESTEGGSRTLAVAELRVLSPSVSLDLQAPAALVPGAEGDVVATLVNTGDVPARGVVVQIGIDKGAEHVAALVGVSPGEQSAAPEAGAAPFADKRRLEWVINEVPAGGGSEIRQFTVQFSEAVGSDATVAWIADVVDPFALSASQTTTAEEAAVAAGTNPDRLENVNKTWIIVFVVIAPLVALLTLLVIRGTAVDNLERAIEAVLVVFLVSAVLIMHLAGGLEAESAAAIVGAVAGYIFGRGVSDKKAGKADQSED